MALTTALERDMVSMRQAIARLSSIKLGPTSTPKFADLTLTGDLAVGGNIDLTGTLTLSALTASRLIATNASKELVSSDLNTWIAGTANEINITDDGDGTVTIGLVDPLIVSKGGTGAATLTDHGLLVGSGTGAITALSAATNGQLPIGSTGNDPVLATLTGTSNQITVTNGAGSITLSTPQDIHTGAGPTFDTLTLSSIANEATDVDKFLVDSSGLIKYRTGAEVLSDIGGSPTSHRHDGETLEHDAVNSDGGAFSFTTTGLVTFNQSIAAANYAASNLLTACATNAGALDFSAASKTLTVEDDAVVSQDYSSDAIPTFANIDVTEITDFTIPMVGDNNKLRHTPLTATSTIVTCTSSVYPPFRCKRTTALTNVTAAGADCLTTSSGNMADGFGGGFTVSIEDDTSGVQLAGAFYGIRDGADNTSGVQIRTRNAGAWVNNLWLDPDGSLTINSIPAEAADVDKFVVSSSGILKYRTGAQVLSDIDGQPKGDILDDLNTLGAPTADGEFIVATGAGVFAYETADTARTSLGVGTGDSPTFTGLDLTGITDSQVPYIGASGFTDGPLTCNANTLTITGGATIALNVLGTSYPVIRGNRTTSATNATAAGLDFLTTSTGNMADGFGGGMTLSIEDDADTINIACAIYGVRDGADNTSGMLLRTRNAGAWQDNMWLDPGGNVGVNTTTPDTKLQVVGDCKFGDDNTNYVSIGTTGDTKFVGGAGLPFGSCYGNHIGWSQAAAAQNTWYNISDADMLDGTLHNVTHDGSGKLTVANAGMYLVTWSCCFEDDAANDHVEIGIEVSGSGSANAAGQAHLENKFASEEEHASSSCILDLAANATLEVAIRTTDAGTPTISVQAVNISCVQIGGT